MAHPHQEPLLPVIVNITGTVLLQGPMDLSLYSEFIPCSSYDATRFAALKICNPYPYYTALVFRCGKVVCIGTTSPQMLKDAIHSIVAKINEFEEEENHHTVPPIVIENIVACTSLSRELCLRKIKTECEFYCHYEPEIFPGLSIALDTEYGTIRSKSFRKETKCKFAHCQKRWATLNDAPADEQEEYAALEALIKQFSTDKKKHVSIKLVVFQTGKINIVGCKCFSDVTVAFDFLKHLCNKSYFSI